jgi:hypothetical protein
MASSDLCHAFPTHHTSARNPHLSATVAQQLKLCRLRRGADHFLVPQSAFSLRDGNLPQGIARI